MYVDSHLCHVGKPEAKRPSARPGHRWQAAEGSSDSSASNDDQWNELYGLLEALRKCTKELRIAGAWAEIRTCDLSVTLSQSCLKRANRTLKHEINNFFE